MFKSVFTKFLSSLAIIIFISFLMLAAIIGSMTNNYAIESKKEDMSWALEVSESSFHWLYADSTQEEFLQKVKDSEPRLQEILDNYYKTSSSLELFIVDAEGEIIVTCTHMSYLKGKHISESDITKIKNNPQQGTLTDLGDVLSERFYVNMSPFTNDNGETLGMVFVCSSSGSETALISSMTKTIIIASLWIMLAAMIAGYFISDRMVSPLKSMISAAKQFGKGKFDSRVEINSNDEIGDLAVAFNQMAESLERLETMRNSFLANVSHDLRTPMTTIAGFIDSINSGAIPPEEQSHYLHIVSAEVHRLSRLVGQLLDIARLESGERKLNFSHFDICELSRIVLISFEQKIEAKNLEVEFNVEEDSMAVEADKDVIHQVLYNLCENAIKFSAEKGIFRLTIERIHSSQLKVTIYNEGAGIPAEDLPYIFDRFYKSDKSRGLDKSGAGLGLHIAKTIVESHNQSICAESEEGKWCAFCFTLKAGNSELPAKLVEF